MASPIIGIDLGTTYSAVARMELGRPSVLLNQERKAITPSVLYFPAPGEQPLAGNAAKAMQESGEADIACFFKRGMGLPDYMLKFHGQEYSAVDCSSLLLKHLVEDVAQVKSPQAMITVPAYFDNRRREDTIVAGERAGIRVLGIINEPTAAAIAFGFNKLREPKTLLVYDLGGGTFDVTIVKIGQDGIDVLGSDGHHELGGIDWDRRIMAYIASKFRDDHGIDPLEDPLACLDLTLRCETAKQMLSSRTNTRVSLTYDGKREAYELDKETFESLTEDLLRQTISLCEVALKDVKLDWVSIDTIVQVGGSTRMPMVTRALKEKFSGEFATGVNPDEAVALGAAIAASQRAEGNEEKVFALGSIRTRDVIAHTLGMVAENGDRSRYINSHIIPKNQPIPSRVVQQFQRRTAKKGSTEIEVFMLQGESSNPLECSLLGKYVISGIEPEPGEMALIDIGYNYDQNGMVSVDATQISTGLSLPVTVDSLPGNMDWLHLAPSEHQASTIEHVSIFIAIDLSGSMSGEPLAKAQEAAKKFVRDLDLTTTSLGLNIFADSTKTTLGLNQSATDLNRGIESWEIGQVGYGNGTNPFDELYQLLKDVAGRRFVVVLTDGAWSHQEKALTSANRLKAEDVEIIAMGFGGADMDFLSILSNVEEGALFTRLEDLTSNFSKIAQVITDSRGHMVAEKSSKRTGLKFF